MNDSLAIAAELKGIRGALDGLKDLKKNLREARDEAVDLGDEAAEAMAKISDTTRDTLEVLDRLGTAAFLDDFSDRIKYAGEAFAVAEDKSRSFAVRTSAAISGASGIVGMFAQNILLASQALAAGAASAEQHERAVRTLGDAWGHVQRETQDTVTAQQALTMQQAFVRNGMSVQGDELGMLARAAREYALVTGTDTPAAMTALTQALQQGDREGLRPFKISVQEGTTRSEAYRQAMQQLRQQQDVGTASARTFAEENARLSRSWTEMQNTVFADIARWTDLRSNIVGVTQALEALRNEGGINGHGDMHRADSQQRTRGLERRDRVGRLMMATAQRLNFRGNLINPTQLSDQQLDFLERTLGDPLGAEDDMRAGLEFASASGTNLQASRAASARAAEEAERARLATRDRDLRTQDRRDRREALSPEERRRQALEATQRRMANEIRGKRSRLQGQLIGEYAANTESFYTDDFELDIDSSLEAQNAMRSQVEDKQRSQIVYEAEQSRLAAEAERTRMNAVNTAGAARFAGVEALEARNDIGGQIAQQFKATQTPAEQAAQSVKGAFDTMTSGLNGFLDTLIESPEKAGEASVQLAKGVLKGIALMALQKSLFSAAEGIVALTNPITAPTAAGFFTAAGIYAGVAVAAGAGAAGIASAQRGSAQPPATAGAGPGSVASVSGGHGGQRGGDTYVISVNGSILDTGGFEQAVGRAVRGARGRGA